MFIYRNNLINVGARFHPCPMKNIKLNYNLEGRGGTKAPTNIFYYKSVGADDSVRPKNRFKFKRGKKWQDKKEIITKY